MKRRKIPAEKARRMRWLGLSQVTPCSKNSNSNHKKAINTSKKHWSQSRVVKRLKIQLKRKSRPRRICNQLNNPQYEGHHRVTHSSNLYIHRMDAQQCLEPTFTGNPVSLLKKNPPLLIIKVIRVMVSQVAVSRFIIWSQEDSYHHKPINRSPSATLDLLDWLRHLIPDRISSHNLCRCQQWQMWLIIIIR